MTVVPCPQCDTAVSYWTSDCPNCGHTVNNWRRFLGWVGFCLVLLGWQLIKARRS